MDKRYGDRMSPGDGLVPHGDSAVADVLGSEVRTAIGRARAWVVGKRTSDGGWDGAAPVLPSLVARFILARRFSDSFLDEELESASSVLLAAQLSDGGWSDEGSQADLNVSVESYLALKIARHGSLDEPLRRAVLCIRRLGGAAACSGETRLLLALFGQIPYTRVPSAGALSSRNRPPTRSWLRRLEATVPLEAEEGIRELFLGRPRRSSVFELLKTAAGWIADALCRPTRNSSRCRSKARRVLCSLMMSLRGGDDDGPGASELLRRVFLLHALGRSDGPAWRRCWKALSRLAVDDESGEGFYFLPNASRARGTAETLHTLQEAGLDTRHPDVARATASLLLSGNRWDSFDDETRLAILAALEGQFAPRSDALPPTAFLVEGNDSDEAETTGSGDPESLLEESTRFIEEHLSRFLKTARPQVVGPRPGSDSPWKSSDDWGAANRRRWSRDSCGGSLRCRIRDGSFGDAGRGSIRMTAQVISGLRAIGIRPTHPVLVASVYWLRLWQEPRGAWREPDDETRKPVRTRPRAHGRRDGGSDRLRKRIRLRSRPSRRHLPPGDATPPTDPGERPRRPLPIRPPPRPR